MMRNPVRKVRFATALLIALTSGAGGTPAAGPDTIDLRGATVIVREGDLAPTEASALTVLIEEVERRTGIRLAPGAESRSGETGAGARIHLSGPGTREGRPPAGAEGFRLVTRAADAAGVSARVEISGADARGVLYGVGEFLRRATMKPGRLGIAAGLDISTAPAWPIRGHQLGFRDRANSWDAWDLDQFDQHIRELAVFGANAIENIPFQDPRTSPLMKLTREEINAGMSRICDRYGMDYWVWTPADFDLNDAEARADMLRRHEELYASCVRMNGVFFPGGDPGDNPPDLVWAFVGDVAERLNARHPGARVWISLQGYRREWVDRIFEYIETESPDWLGGLVAGPSSPPVPMLRPRLPRRYGLRLYPDITHNKLCQYAVPWWDQALARTLGREAVNPRPVQYAAIHNRFAPYSDGFISYSDGVHDDVNKIIWLARGWNPEADVREVMIEYGRFFFGPDAAERTADLILALEKNWQGPLATNGAVDAVLAEAETITALHPALAANWRWQMNLLRANYDAHVRHRLILDTELEARANRALAAAGSIGADAAADAALEILALPDSDTDSGSARARLRRRIIDLCDDLFDSIRLQTSVTKHMASGAERGAVLDFIDLPLNNRWWIEDELAKVRAMDSETEKLARIAVIRDWENPGPGGYYDDIGNPAKSPRVVRGESDSTDPHMVRNPGPTYWWWDQGLTRERLSWQCSMEWPLGVSYIGLDPDAEYFVRLTGYNQSLLRIDGERVTPRLDGRGLGEFKEFDVPSPALADGQLMLTWDAPTDEGHLNWRQQSRLTEVWLIRK